MKGMTLALLATLAFPLIPAPARADGESLQTAARRTIRAIVAGDRTALEAAMITYEELQTLAPKALSRAQYQTEVKAMVTKLTQEIAEAQMQGKKIDPSDAQIADIHLLPKGDKRKQLVIFATVRFSVAVGGGKLQDAPWPIYFYFIAVSDKWKLSPKK